VDGPTDAVFGCTKWQCYDGRISGVRCERPSGRERLATQIAKRRNILQDASEGTAVNALERRQQSSYRPDNGRFSGPPVAHDKHAANARIDKIKQEGKLHVLLRHDRGKRILGPGWPEFVFFA
jgi:hypothetical protein